jgi:DNA-binding MarR family transcriptional regulator
MASPSAISELLNQVRNSQGIVAAGTDMVISGSPLSPARFLLLRVVAFSQAAKTVPTLARHLAVSRQAIQRLADGLAKDGIVALRPNPHHLKAPLVVMTPKGRQLFDLCESRYQEWLASLAGTFSDDEVDAATKLLQRLQECIAGSDPAQTGR